MLQSQRMAYRARNEVMPNPTRLTKVLDPPIAPQTTVRLFEYELLGLPGLILDTQGSTYTLNQYFSICGDNSVVL